MQYIKTQILHNGIYRLALIIADKIPIDIPSDNAIIQTKENCDIVYYTDGLFKSEKKDGIYYNYYLVNREVERNTDIQIKITQLEQKAEDLKRENNHLQDDIHSEKQINTDLAQAVLDLQYQNAVNQINQK